MALREILARFGFQVDRRGLAAADKGISGVVGKLQAFGAVIAGSVVVRGIANFVGDIVDAGDALGKTATQLGLSSDQLQGWQAAAGYAGVEATKFNQSMRVLQKNTLLAVQGSKQAVDAFDMLGIEIEDTNGQLKAGDVLMREVGLALNDLENSTERVALAQQLMGRTGAALLPLFKDGEVGLDAALEALERFGGGLSKDLIPLAEAAQDRFADFSLATTSLKSRLAVGFLPILNQVVLGLAKFFAAISKVTKNTNLFQAVLVTLGAVLTKLAIAKFGGSLLALGKAALIPLIKIALLVLLVDDLITLFRGGKSVIGEFLDKLFGEGSSKALVDSINAVIDALKDGDFEGAFDIAINKLSALGDKIFQVTGKVPGLTTGLFGVIGVLLELGETIREQIPVWSKAATELGDALVDGIVKALRSGAGKLATAAAHLLGGTVAAAATAIQKGSPSKLAQREVGTPLAEGMFDVKGAMQAARQYASIARAAIPTAPASLTAQARGGAGAALPRGGVIFQSKVDLSVSGGAPSDPQIQKLRQGLRSELTDNRRATLAALTQTVEAT